MNRRHAGLAERIARELLLMTDERFSPPVDLPSLAHLIGVRAISTRPLVEDGRVVWDAGGPSIELRPDRPVSRQRFTLAHEIAHVVLAGKSGAGQVARRTVTSDPNGEEELCDAVAAALLMPRDWMERHSRGNLNLSTLRLIAHHAEVSLSAAAVRVAEVGRRTSILLRWRKLDDDLICASAAAVPPDLFGRIRLAKVSVRTIAGLPRHDVWADVEVSFDGQSRSARAHLSCREAGCLMLITEIRKHP